MYVLPVQFNVCASCANLWFGMHDAYTMHIAHTTPYTTHRTLRTIHHAPYTMHHTPYTIHHAPYAKVINKVNKYEKFHESDEWKEYFHGGLTGPDDEDLDSDHEAPIVKFLDSVWCRVYGV